MKGSVINEDISRVHSSGICVCVCSARHDDDDDDVCIALLHEPGVCGAAGTRT